MILEEKLAAQIPEWRARVTNLIKEYGNVKVGDVSIEQVYGGMRDVKSMVTDISFVDANEGIRFRGYSIPEVLDKLPKPKNGNVPLVGGLYYLLLLGEIPTYEEAMQVEDEWHARSEVPNYVFHVIDSMPPNTYPMTMFSQAILAMQGESKFAVQLYKGMRKEDYWIPTLEDSLNLTAKMPEIAAYIYAKTNGIGTINPPIKENDWGANFGHMLKVNNKEFSDLARLFFILHSDHESGNVSAHAMHLVASALSDIYLASSAAMNGLAGPLHGRANQETLKWLTDVYKKYAGVPTEDQLRDFCWETLNRGSVIPGYGHAVLRKTDPRFTALYEFGKKYMPDDEVFELANLVYNVAPDVLREHGKAKNPWPNVDAISGSILLHYGISDCAGEIACGFYTVMFGVSRLLGITANQIWARALGQPIERPKSLTTAMLEEIAHNGK